MKNKIIPSTTDGIIFIMLLVFCTASFSFAGPESKAFYLEEAMKPFYMAVNDNYCFIGERFCIFQYSLKDFKLVKKIGRRGLGPQEFPVILDIRTNSKHLIVSSLSRVYIYSAEGEYIFERKTKAWCTEFDMANGHFLGMETVKENKKAYETINLLNDDLSKNKELYRYKKFMILGSSEPHNPLTYGTYYCFIGEKILISTDDDRILLFDRRGEKQREIKLNLEKRRIPEEFKKSYFDNFKENPRKKMVYDTFKDRIEWGDYFPYIRFARVDSKRIYIITYQEKDNKSLCLVLDLNGKELGRSFILLPPVESFSYPFTFHNGAFYYLKDDPDKEQWVVIKEQIIPVSDAD